MNSIEVPKNDSPGAFFVKKRLLQKSEGNFSEQISRWILRSIFWWIFCLFLRWKDPPKNQQHNSNQNLGGVSQPNSTPQESGLDYSFSAFESEGVFARESTHKCHSGIETWISSTSVLFLDQELLKTSGVAVSRLAFLGPSLKQSRF